MASALSLTFGLFTAAIAFAAASCRAGPLSDHFQALRVHRWACLRQRKGQRENEVTQVLPGGISP